MKQSEIRLTILEVLNAAKSQGAVVQLIMDCLQIQDLPTIEKYLKWLRKRHFIKMQEQAFFITDEGFSFLKEQRPDIDFPNSGGGPSGNGPDDPPKVPKRPLISPGAGAVTLSTPDTNDL